MHINRQRARFSTFYSRYLKSRNVAMHGGSMIDHCKPSASAAARRFRLCDGKSGPYLAPDSGTEPPLRLDTFYYYYLRITRVSERKFAEQPLNGAIK